MFVIINNEKELMPKSVPFEKWRLDLITRKYNYKSNFSKSNSLQQVGTCV